MKDFCDECQEVLMCSECDAVLCPDCHGEHNCSPVQLLRIGSPALADAPGTPSHTTGNSHVAAPAALSTHYFKRLPAAQYRSRPMSNGHGSQSRAGTGAGLSGGGGGGGGSGQRTGATQHRKTDHNHLHVPGASQATHHSLPMRNVA
mmetsp:Transcript_7186/g.17736  ORF Transcript_7186/g.17736 Transcript_7186/m.17736 type:complete len:147 (+) Transcript_7186:42-482(+)